MKTDIVVVGSGIAASAALIRLQQLGFSVTQIAPLEKSSDKIGETLSCSSNQFLKQLQLWDTFLGRGYLVQDLVFSAWDQPTLTRQSRFSMTQGSTWSIDRSDFEDFLRVQSNNGCHHRLFKKIKTCNQTTDGLILDIDDHPPLQAKFVIDCSGRSAIIGRRLSRRHRIDNMICYYSFIKQSDTEIEPTVGIMIEAVENGWWYSAILPDWRMIVSFYTYSDLVHQHLNRDAQAWRSLIDQAPLTLQRIKSAGYGEIEAPLASDAGMLMQSESSGKNWIAAGDAIASLDPLSSHGMTQALWSGCRAAEACINSIHGDHSEIDKFEQTVTQAMQAYQNELITKYQSVQRFASYSFWKRRSSLDFQKKSA